MKNQESRSIAYCFAETQVKPEDITCVHAALKGVDPETLLCVLLETRLSWKVDPRLLTGAARRHLMNKTRAMLSLMYDIEPAPLSNPHAVIVPVQVFEYPGWGMSIVRRISAAVLDVSQCPSEEAGMLDYARVISQCMPSAQNASKSVGIESADRFIGCAWSEVLGHAIWLPSALTEYERTSQLAHLFWVMAFSGFAEAVHEMRSVNLRRSGIPLDASQKVMLCFEEHESKMFDVASLMSYNSVQEVPAVSEALKHMLVA